MTKNQRDRGGLSLKKTVLGFYQAGHNDYAMPPLVLCDQHGDPIGRIQDGDAVIFCCRRGEREVELTEAFIEPNFHHFPRKDLSHLTFVILTLYHEKFKTLPVAFAPEKISGTLGQTLSQAGMRQYRVAESEKFSHVTFFLNMGCNHPFPGETDICIPSPHGVPYEQVPELSLDQVVARVLEGIADHIPLIVTNFANGDVIGHTANPQAKIKCAEAIDRALQTTISTALQANTTVMVTADHGNLELMFNPDGSPHVAHTDNPVPFLLVEPGQPGGRKLSPGSLPDIAPTVLKCMGIPQPIDMTGKALCDETIAAARKVLLIILDGWGIGQADQTNPIFLAQTPYWDWLLKNFPNTQLHASGEWVGLEPGKAGNSEAGHMNIGAGRLILQDDTRLELAIENGTFNTNPVFLQTIQTVKQSNASLHLIGLLSEKSSHGCIDYPLALLRLARQHNLKKVYLHLVFDGRSTEPGSAPAMLEKLNQQINEIGTGQIASAIGRGLALDRNQDYTKIQRAYDALVFGKGHPYTIG